MQNLMDYVQLTWSIFAMVYSSDSFNDSLHNKMLQATPCLNTFTCFKTPYIDEFKHV